MLKPMEVIQGRAESIAALNLYLLRLTPSLRKKTILVMWEGGVLTSAATDVLIEVHGLEAL